MPESMPEIPAFDRRFFDSDVTFSRIGEGEPGGKAMGLIHVAERLRADLDAGAFPGLTIDIPRSIVVLTGVFDAFMRENRLDASDLEGLDDDHIANRFLRADLPTLVLGDLEALVRDAHRPLAVRSSSLLEDALHRPFAGVYATKMTPNNQPDIESRFKRLVEAIKTVYASVFFASARSYLATTDVPPGSEKMAVVIQEVVGGRHGARFYPECSGVGRSYNFYPFGTAAPEEGAVELALGLGKTIVDGGITWAYSPAHPTAPPPFGSVEDRLHNTQLSFWAVNMGSAPYDPMAADEYLVRGDLREAEYDGTLDRVASTFIAESERLVPGVGRKGARVLDFAPLLDMRASSFNTAVSRLLEIGEGALGGDVEIELALTFSDREGGGRGRLALLQVRPMLVSHEEVQVPEEEMSGDRVVIATDRAMGNGSTTDLHDVVYVRPERFRASHTRVIARELAALNRRMRLEKRPYVLIGFGRWGSSDPSLGIPVEWGDVSGVRCLVEATLPEMNVELSQGAHFFHNITSFSVPYLMVGHSGPRGIDWSWLDAQPAISESDDVRHVRLERPLTVKVDGRTGRGVVYAGDGAN